MMDEGGDAGDDGDEDDLVSYGRTCEGFPQALGFQSCKSSYISYKSYIGHKSSYNPYIGGTFSPKSPIFWLRISCISIFLMKISYILFEKSGWPLVPFLEEEKVETCFSMNKFDLKINLKNPEISYN